MIQVNLRYFMCCSKKDIYLFSTYRWLLLLSGNLRSWFLRDRHQRCIVIIGRYGIV